LEGERSGNERTSHAILGVGCEKVEGITEPEHGVGRRRKGEERGALQ